MKRFMFIALLLCATFQSQASSGGTIGTIIAEYKIANTAFLVVCFNKRAFFYNTNTTDLTPIPNSTNGAISTCDQDGIPLPYKAFESTDDGNTLIQW